VLRVRDTGLGIAPDFLPRVFDLFTQANRSSDRSQGGLGIGLALVKRPVEMHEGTVRVSCALTVFRPPLMLIDLAMPDLDGCRLVTNFRQMPAFAQTKIVAVTGFADLGHKTMAITAGFDMVLFKSAALPEIKAVLASVAPVISPGGQAPEPAKSVRRWEPSKDCRFAKRDESGTSAHQER
jgi:CheY-like chemotaxis protein